jgi:hypothetical protein
MLNAAISPNSDQNPRSARICRLSARSALAGWSPGGGVHCRQFRGAEFSINDGDCENEAVYEIEQRLAGRPDPAIDSHFEYGSRAGWWRIMEVLGQHGAPATVSSSGRAVERLPDDRRKDSRRDARCGVIRIIRRCRRLGDGPYSLATDGQSIYAC